MWTCNLTLSTNLSQSGMHARRDDGSARGIDARVGGTGARSATDRLSTCG